MKHYGRGSHWLVHGAHDDDDDGGGGGDEHDVYEQLLHNVRNGNDHYT